MKYWLITTSAALMLVACSGADQQSAATEEIAAGPVVAEATTPEAVAEAPTASVTVTGAYIKPPLKGRDVGAAFFTASNSGDADAAIVSASTPIAAEVELHTHTMTDGVMAMREVEQILVPAGGSVELKPGSFHLMLFGVSMNEGTSEAPITLTYADGTTETLSVPVQSGSE